MKKHEEIWPEESIPKNGRLCKHKNTDSLYDIICLYLYLSFIVLRWHGYFMVEFYIVNVFKLSNVYVFGYFYWSVELTFKNKIQVYLTRKNFWEWDLNAICLFFKYVLNLFKWN